MLRYFLSLGCESVVSISNLGLLGVIEVSCKPRQLIDNQRQLFILLISLIAAIVVIRFLADKQHQAHDFSVSLPLCNI